MTMQNETALAGQEVRLNVRAVADAPRVVTMIAEMEYDAARLTTRGCEISPGIGEKTAAGKSLSVLSPTPGLIRAVLAGSLQPVPGNTDVFSCTFAVAAGAPAGAAPVRLHGEVADAAFADYAFVADANVIINKNVQ